MTIHSGRGNSVNTEAYLHNTKVSNSDYVVLGDEKRTASKSLLSKAKNLLYTLSTPFRALTRTELHRRVGQGEENSAAFKNIKSTPMPRSTTNERKTEFSSQLNQGYTVVSEKGGYGKSSLFDRIWG
jgi:Mrp family chromosome partitioning ATPase